MKSLILLLMLIIMSCAYLPTAEESRKQEESYRQYQLDKMVREQNLKDSCWKYDNCKGAARVYNRSYILKHK